MGASKNFLVILVALAVTILGLLYVDLRANQVPYQFLLSLLFLVISLFVLSGAYRHREWTWRLSGIFFVVYLLNLLLLYNKVDESLLIGSLGLVAVFGLLFSIMINKCQRVRKSKPAPKVQVINVKPSKTRKKLTPGKFLASSDGSVYHAPKCDWAKRIARKNRVWLNSKDEAKKKGYKQHSCLL